MTKRTKRIILIYSVALCAIATLVVVLILMNPERPQYTVSYDLNGGTMAEKNTIVTLDEQYALPSPTKEGYKFIGWFLDGEYFNAMGTWHLEHNVELTAMWEIRDDAGFVYERVEGGYRVVNYKGLVKERIVVPDTYDGELVVDISKNTFVDLKRFFENGEIEGLLIYIPMRFDERCDDIAFDSRVEIARYNDMDDSGFAYTKHENGYIVEEYNGAVLDNLIIPCEYKGMPVISVKSDAFNVLKSSVEGDDSIKQVNVYIPDTVGNFLVDAAVVGKIRFATYSEIVPDGLVYLYNGNAAMVMGYIGEYGTSLTVPCKQGERDVTAIGAYAFYGAVNYITLPTEGFFLLKLPESVSLVGEYAFELSDGMKIDLYHETDGKEFISNPSRVFDWMSKATIDDTNKEFVDVIYDFRAAIGASKLYTNSLCYVRFELGGGKVIEYMENGKDENGNPVLVPVEFNDITLAFAKPYVLPTPVREGYTFDGWYYGEELVPIEDEKWTYHKYIAIEAKWTEIQKEG